MTIFALHSAEKDRPGVLGKLLSERRDEILVWIGGEFVLEELKIPPKRAKQQQPKNNTHGLKIVSPNEKVIITKQCVFQ